MTTVSQAELLRRTLDAMEDDLKIPPKNARDFLESARAVIESALAEGEKVSAFGIVNLTPSGVLAKPKRKGTDPRTGEEKTFDPKPASVRVKATVTKRLKDALPEPTDKAGKTLLSEARARKAATEQRAADRAAEAEREAKKAARKGGTSKKSSKK